MPKKLRERKDHIFTFPRKIFCFSVKIKLTRLSKTIHVDKMAALHVIDLCLISDIPGSLPPNYTSGVLPEQRARSSPECYKCGPTKTSTQKHKIKNKQQRA